MNYTYNLSKCGIDAENDRFGPLASLWSQPCNISILFCTRPAHAVDVNFIFPICEHFNPRSALLEDEYNTYPSHACQTLPALQLR